MSLSTEVGLSLRDCVSMGPSSPSQKGAEPPIFGPGLLWQNGCVDQDATGTEIGLGLRDSPLPQFSANVPCGQTAGWTKMPLGMEVDLGPDDFVFDGDPATPEKKAHSPPPNF